VSSVFVDTSAIYAFLVPEDDRHLEAKALFESLRAADPKLVCSSYVLQETVALLQARIGIPAVRTFQKTVAPAIEVEWITGTLYHRAMAALLAAGKREVSLTDWTSFEVMRDRGIEQAFAFDGDFEDQGFRVLSENQPYQS
jgi:predicted nucleic acid-binding protein